MTKYILSAILVLAVASFTTSCDEEKEPGKENEKKESADSTLEVTDDIMVEEVEVAPKMFVYMEGEISLDSIETVLGNYFGAVFQIIGPLPIEKSMPVAYTRDFNPEDRSAPFHLEAGVLVDGPELDAQKLELPEGIKMRFFHQGSALMAVHIGPYDQVDKTYEAIFAYADKEKYGVIMNESWEIYTNDPQEVGLENARTEVYVPIAN